MVRAARGTRDLLPGEAGVWLAAERKIRSVASRFGFQEIRTPIFEPTELYLRNTGQETGVVQKEMYTFPDKKGRSLTLRPEGTPSVVRACVEHGLLGAAKPLKFFYLGPMFRYERPGAGRTRQFHQMGVELLGIESPAADVEVIAEFSETLKELEIHPLPVLVNSLGCRNDRSAYVAALKESVSGRIHRGCADCQERFKTNPLRILDCKVESCRKEFSDVPTMEGFLCEDCRRHFSEVRELLELLRIEYRVDARLVRGLDYYTRTVFEVHHEKLGAEGALGGGGRYDDLVRDLGGPPTPAVGYSAGLERLLMALQMDNPDFRPPPAIDLCVVAVTAEERAFALELAHRLRKEFKVEVDLAGRSLAAQMKRADRLGARLAILAGPEELAQEAVTVRNLVTGEQKLAGLKTIEETLRKELR